MLSFGGGNKSKNDIFDYIDGQCAVCVRNEKDYSEKPVKWCSTCKVYICKRHWNAYLERGEAWLRGIFY